MVDEAVRLRTTRRLEPMLEEADQRLIRRIKAITGKGNDAEVRRKRDGTLAVYEVKKRAVEE